MQHATHNATGHMASTPLALVTSMSSEPLCGGVGVAPVPTSSKHLRVGALPMKAASRATSWLQPSTHTLAVFTTSRSSRTTLICCARLVRQHPMPSSDRMGCGPAALHTAARHGGILRRGKGRCNGRASRSPLCQARRSMSTRSVASCSRIRQWRATILGTHGRPTRLRRAVTFAARTSRASSGHGMLSRHRRFVTCTQPRPRSTRCVAALQGI